MQKLTFFLVTIVSAIGLYFGLNTYSVITTEEDTAESIAELDYDGVSSGINTVMFNSDGSIHYTLQADRQFHFKDSTSSLEQPFIRLFRDGESHWNIIADSGRISPNPSTQESNIGNIELTGAVEVYTLDEFGNRTVLSTEFLSIDTQAETMESDIAVSMVSTNIEQSAIGLFADLNSDEIQFLQDTVGRYAYSINR